MLSHMELPADLAGYGEERLGKLEVGDLRSECARRGLDVKPQAQKNTCIKLLLEWKAAQGGPKAQGLPFDLAHYGKERLEKLDVAVLRTECGLRGIDVKVLAQTSTCVAELLKSCLPNPKDLLNPKWWAENVPENLTENKAMKMEEGTDGCEQDS